MTGRLFCDDYKTTPYWWEATPRPEISQHELPAKTDVVVIGAGYSGLSAALQTSRAGRHTVVLDAEDVGWGCSTRNGGQISTSIKPNYHELAAKYGPERAFKILKEGHNALAWIEDFVASEKIDCHFKIAGKFTGAHNPAQYQRLGKIVDNQQKGLESDAYLVPRAEQHTELGSDLYHGGIVYPKFASIDPACFHQGLLQSVLESEATVLGHCAVTELARAGDDFRVTTAKGSIRASNVIVATNGYTGSFLPWLRRRIIPIGSYIIATEPLKPGQMDRLIPRDRVIGDTRRMVYYCRASPDRKRILFGGR